MKLLQKALGRFTIRDLTLIAALSATGIAAKAVTVPLMRIVSTPLLIPGGALGGGYGGVLAFHFMRALRKFDIMPE